MKNSTLFRFAALVVFAFGLHLTAAAQGNPGSGGPQPGQPTAVPIDGGASLLLAGGAAYALSRLRRR
ncbi:PID-CTERM protein-sorting domain-containing protein [Hymenobacter sp. B81]|uniref:PID-CTERM protein-sorting domain-containing protein n=1 Tax=Hymenobacter sp. B81 TaxID=3344878 RepID=UPI0037DC1014